jgi:ribose 5-phosphate isomerase A
LDVNEMKRRAAWRAVEFVEDGMVVGLGHGSTAAFAVERIAELLRAGGLTGIVCVPCSEEVADHAERLGIALTTLDESPSIDVTIDGADEVDARMNLVKGGGGALLREKIVADSSEREIIVVDGSKLSLHLGTRFALPVEVVPFAWIVERRSLETLGAHVLRRGGDDPFLTDQGNYILDCDFGPIEEPAELSRRLDARPGIVGHGLFIGLATDLVVATERGVRHFAKGSDLSEVIAR